MLWYNLCMWFFGKGKQKISIDLSGKKAVSSIRTFVHGGMSIVLFILCILALIISYHFYSKYAELRVVVEHSDTSAISGGINPSQAIIAAVDKHLLLPTGEEPNIAKVTDLAPLEGYVFFRNATVGDEVIVYCTAQLSILYSPARDKLIEVTRQALSGACK